MPFDRTEIVTFHEVGKLTPANVSNLIGELEQLMQRQEQISGPLSADRRRSQRVMLQVAVLVQAELPNGEKVQTQAFTVVVNAHGGLLDFPVRLAIGQTLILINPQSWKHVDSRVVAVQRSSEGSFAIAFEFAEPNSSFWPVTFPPLDWAVREELA